MYGKKSKTLRLPSVAISLSMKRNRQRAYAGVSADELSIAMAGQLSIDSSLFLLEAMSKNGYLTKRGMRFYPTKKGATTYGSKS